MKPNLTKLGALKGEQLKKISTDIDQVGVRKAAAMATNETATDIDKSTLQRFDERSIAKDFLVETPDTAAAAIEILRYAATGRPDFSDATLKVLEQSAFKLSLACTRSPEQMKALEQMSSMICRFRGTSVRERMAKVQEDKLELRREEMALKQAVAQAKIQAEFRKMSSAQRNSATSTRNSEIQHDHLGPLPKTPADIEARATKKFDLPPIDRTKQCGTDDSNVVSNNSSEESPQSPVRARSTASPVPNPVSSIGALVESNPHSAPNSRLEIRNSNLPEVYRQNEKNSIQTLTNEIESKNTPKTEVPAISKPTNPSSLQDRVNDYTLARFEEATIGKDKWKVGRNAAIRFNSKMQHCPCGHALPCPQHGGFPKMFWELSPESSDYIDIFHDKGLPYTAPRMIIKQREDHERHVRFLQWKKSNLTLLEAQSKAYAIARWRACTPRPRGVPQPGDNWHQHCPCGAPLPCEHHGNLWSQVYAMKPWDKDYIALLQQYDIPVYTPTEPERIYLDQPIAAVATAASTSTSSPISSPELSTGRSPSETSSTPEPEGTSDTAATTPESPNAEANNPTIQPSNHPTQ